MYDVNDTHGIVVFLNDAFYSRYGTCGCSPHVVSFGRYHKILGYVSVGIERSFPQYVNICIVR